MNLVSLESTIIDSLQSRADNKLRQNGFAVKSIIKKLNRVIVSERNITANVALPRAKRNLMISMSIEFIEKLEQAITTIQLAREDAIVRINHFCIFKIRNVLYMFVAII